MREGARRFVLTDRQREQLDRFEEEFLRFNSKHNLISSETEDRFYERHVLHCLTLARRTFPAGSVVVDWGTGGGLPAIPLAICFPEVTVHAVDAVRKKILAVQAMGRRLELDNLHAWHGRAEAWPGAAHYSVSRATAPLVDLWTWHRRVRRPWDGPLTDDAWRPGLLCLKGGDLRDEIEALRDPFSSTQVELHPVRSLLERDLFADKYVVEVHDRPRAPA